MMPLGNIGLIVTSEFDLCSGDRLLFYTDGLTNPKAPRVGGMTSTAVRCFSTNSIAHREYRLLRVTAPDANVERCG